VGLSIVVATEQKNDEKIRKMIKNDKKLACPILIIDNNTRYKFTVYTMYS
jgi:hypothetical protein